MLSQDSKSTSIYYSCVWRKVSNKKHKTWDGDGIFVDRGDYGVLMTATKKHMGKSRLKAKPSLGDLVRAGVYEVELEAVIPKPVSDPRPASSPVAVKDKQQRLVGLAGPLLSDRPKPVKKGEPLFDPLSESAIVMPRVQLKAGQQAVDVVIDPILRAKLRPHQVEGVKFMYECVMGLRDYGGCGALLADDMGLGKTLMTITLLWTLMKQSPIAGQPPPVRRALIVCPVTLIANWKHEFAKWLGQERIGIFVADSNARLRDFFAGRVYQVMLIGYERIRTVAADLADKQDDFDIIVCDEGHRLKSIANKSAQAIMTFNTERRIILSGTPIQNDLGEFYAMIDFLNPGLLGTPSAFKRDFEIPIMRSRQPEAMEKDREKGAEKSEVLGELTSQFVLRRSADTLKTFLPPKTETVVFCRPTGRQLSCYRDLLSSSAIEMCFTSSEASDHLRAITLLKKACNTPLLLEESPNKCLPGDIVDVSGKTQFLAAFLRALHTQTKEKVVIVSLYTQTLDVLEQVVGSLNMGSLRLDGKTPAQKRHALVEQFNKGPRDETFVLLLSSKTGGTGLNLVGASRLILFDTDWNPSVDLQAMARVHRDGQKMPVYIYRLLSTGLIDEKIYQRQITKQGLADSFMGTDAQKANAASGGTGSSNVFSMAELKDLFTIHCDTLSNTHDLLECRCLDLQEHEQEREPEPTQTQEDDSPSQVQLGGWMTASAVHAAGLPVRSVKKENIQALFEYQHMIPSPEECKHDAILLEALRSSVVSLLFTKTSTAPAETDSRLDDAHDMINDAM